MAKLNAVYCFSSLLHCIRAYIENFFQTFDLPARISKMRFIWQMKNQTSAFSCLFIALRPMPFEKRRESNEAKSIERPKQQAYIMTHLLNALRARTYRTPTVHFFCRSTHGKKYKYLPVRKHRVMFYILILITLLSLPATAKFRPAMTANEATIW